MNSWNLIPWTLQYPLSGIVIIITATIVLSKNRRSLAYQMFFAFGFSTAIWEIMAFLHRNAPSRELSDLFFRIDLFFVPVSFVFLPLTIFFISNDKRGYLWLIAPALFIGAYALSTAPFDLFMSNYGWSFKLESGFRNLFYLSNLFYMLLFCAFIIQLVRRVNSKILARKYLFIMFAYLFICYGIAMIISTWMIQINPDFPPLGGILTLLQFMLISYAITISPKKSIPHLDMKGVVKELSEAYTLFLNRFFEVVPGKELGEDSFRFRDYLEAMGIDAFFNPASDKLILNEMEFTGDYIYDTPDNIIRLIKEHIWAQKLMGDFIHIIDKTYETLKIQSEDTAEEWFDKLLVNHGGFLIKNNVIEELKQTVNIPEFLKDLRPGKHLLFEEDIPGASYRLITVSQEYSIKSICITKMNPKAIKEKFGVKKSLVYHMTFKNEEDKSSYTDTGKILDSIYALLTEPDGTIVLIDCLDQIKFANGFRKTFELLQNIKQYIQNNNAFFILSIPTSMFEKEELEAIRDVLNKDIQK